ncbi:hypothetical protein ES708_25220 [subsurface metagenome]
MTEVGLKGADYIAMPYPLGGAVWLSDDLIVKPGQFFRFAVAVVEGVI